MRVLLALVLLAASLSAAGAQTSTPLLEALRNSFPEEHAALAQRLVGQSPEAARRLTQEALEQFQTAHRDAILAAPGARLIALEARHGAMLRALRARDVTLCAAVGDRGFFSREARAAPPAAGLEDYSVALVEAAAAGVGRTAPQRATTADFQAWLAEIARREPDVPVQKMLHDRAFRAAAGAENLCVGAAVMHEAVAGLPPDQAARIAGLLVRSIIFAGSPAN